MLELRSRLVYRDAVDGGVDDLYYHGILWIELNDGKIISSIIEENLLQELKGHDMVIIKKSNLSKSTVQRLNGK